MSVVAWVVARDLRLATPDSLPLSDLDGAVDFALAFAVVHEMDDVPGFFRPLHRALNRGAALLVAEPADHVSAADYNVTIRHAQSAGFRGDGAPSIRGCLSTVLRAR